MKKKIAFLCNGDPEDKSLWSGTMYKMYESLLKKGYEVEYLPAVKFTQKEEARFEKIAKVHEKIFNRTFNRHQFYLKARVASKKLQKTLKNKDFDVLFSACQINEIAFLNIKQPIIFVNDILLDQHIGYYPYYMGLGWYSKKIMTYIEQRALQNCAAVILPSEWSVERAMERYQLNPEKVHLLRFGPNIEVPENIFQKEYSGSLTMLFLGVDWQRKGGEIALKTTEILRKKGFPVKLLVVGCVPPVQSEAMEVIPFLNKNRTEDYDRLKKLLLESHLLFLPTRAECYGIVYCEASAYGLPSIATATGGVTSIVKDGINGFALPESAGAEEYAGKIAEILSPEQLSVLSESSRKRYDEHLTWEKWGKEMYEILKKI